MIKKKYIITILLLVFTFSLFTCSDDESPSKLNITDTKNNIQKGIFENPNSVTGQVFSLDNKIINAFIELYAYPYQTTTQLEFMDLIKNEKATRINTTEEGLFAIQIQPPEELTYNGKSILWLKVFCEGKEKWQQIVTEQKPVELNVVLDDIIYVSKKGNDELSGHSPEESLLTVQQAINKANDGTEIRISQGNYEENISFKENIYLSGGFSPETWEKSITEHTVLLSGIDCSENQEIFKSPEVSKAVFDGIYCDKLVIPCIRNKDKFYKIQDGDIYDYETNELIPPVNTPVVSYKAINPFINYWGAKETSDHYYSNYPCDPAPYNSGYTYEGIAAYCPNNWSGTVPLYRFRHTMGFHIYQANNPVGPDPYHVLEGLLAYVYPSNPNITNVVPLYMVGWTDGVSHRDTILTISWSEVQMAINNGYAYDGIIGWVYNQEIPGCVGLRQWHYYNGVNLVDEPGCNNGCFNVAYNPDSGYSKSIVRYSFFFEWSTHDCTTGAYKSILHHSINVEDRIGWMCHHKSKNAWHHFHIGYTSPYSSYAVPFHPLRGYIKLNNGYGYNWVASFGDPSFGSSDNDFYNECDNLDMNIKWH